MSVVKKIISLEHIPAVIWGVPSSKVYLYVHGQGGNKEEAAAFAEIVCRYGFQTLSIDLPEHGERKDEKAAFLPWEVVPEIQSVMEYARKQWQSVSLYANSIGAWFSMQRLASEPLQNCMFVSPVVDMVQLIQRMMGWANVTEEQLKNEKIISTSFGQTLSWDYWRYAVEHPIINWRIPTKILYGENDNMTDFDTIRQFAVKFYCDLTVMKNSGHWLHTEQELTVLKKWIKDNFKIRKNPEQIR